MLIIRAKVLGAVYRKKVLGSMVVRCRIEAEELGGVCDATALAAVFPVHLLAKALCGQYVSVTLPDPDAGGNQLPMLLPWSNQGPETSAACWAYLQERATSDIDEVPWANSRHKAQANELERLLQIEPSPEQDDAPPPDDSF